jgi:RNA polymerase sigma-54 factor
MNSMDLEMLVREEMLENPFLEMADDEEALQASPDDIERAAEAAEAPGADVESGLSDNTRETGTALEDEPFEREYTPPTTDADGEGHSDPGNDAEGSEEYQKLNESDVDWAEEYSESDPISYSGTNEEREDNDFTTYTGASQSLYDSLVRQLQLSILAGKNYDIGFFIIGNINQSGYLDSALSTQALMVGYPAELVEPDNAGSEERVDKALRHLLARLRKGEDAGAFVGMKRKELIHRIVAELLGLTYDKVAQMRPDEMLVRLIAKRIRKPAEELLELDPADLLLEVIAFRTNSTPDQVFDVLEVIHDFEPTGVGARNLAECLRLQCEEKGIRNRVLYQILDEHLNDLQQKRFRDISRALNVPEEKVVEVFNTLSTLDPKPGRSMTKDEVQYITPDVYVKKVDGKYLYFLNEGDAARLKVAANYRRLMAQKPRKGSEAARLAHAAAANGNGTHAAAPAVDADYASEKYKSAVWLIRNIEKRKSTILRVTESIMDYQKEFLEKGIEHLRPLTLRDIAERVGMHESTIARVTTKKYVETPRGIFELKYFFSSGLETDDGEAASSRSIKELLTQMIEAEDRRRPLSDQKIADMLRAKGFQIARRTVAKYREQLKILPAKLRKDVG